MNVGGNIAISGGGGVQARLAGPANSAFYLGGVNSPAIVWCLAPVYLTNGSLTTGASFFVGYAQTINGVSYTNGTLTVNGPTASATQTAISSWWGAMAEMALSHSLTAQ